jgi:hypothetical protein
VPVRLLDERTVVGARAFQADQRSGRSDLCRVLDDIFPVRIRLRGHAFLLYIPQLMGGMVDNPDHFGVDADGRLDRRRAVGSRATLRRRWLRLFSRRATSGRKARTESTDQNRVVQFIDHWTLPPVTSRPT